MKKILYTILAAAAVIAAAGCAKETVPGAGEVDANFTVSFAESATKAVSDGLTATQLVVGVYDKATGYVESLSKPVATADANAFTALKATFSARLVKGHGYDIVFIAQAPGNTAYTIDLAAKTFTVNPAGLSNDETRDAFYSVYSIDKVEEALVATVTLKRPFAQLNVIDLKADYEAAKTAGVTFGKSSLKLTAPTVMNLLDGTVGTPKEYDLAANAVSVVNPDFEPYKAQGDYWLLNDYILAGTATANHDIAFSLYEEGAAAPLFTQTVTNVPLQRNYRTNLYGNLLTSDGDFSIIIEPQYEGMNDVAIGDGEIPAIVMTDSTLPAAGSTLTAEVGGTINFAATHPIATIKPTYSSSKTEVGTINTEGLFTAVAAGTTEVSIAFPQVENGVAKATTLNYAAYTVKYTVTVGEAATAVDPTLEVTGVPTAAVASGASFGIQVTTNSTGAVSFTVAPEGAVTVVAGTTVGAYTVTAAELTADTEVTLTVNVAAVPDLFTAATKAVKFTVSKTAVDNGDGTLANPYTVAGVRAYLDSSDYDATANVYVKGKISSIYKEFVSGGDGTFYISADGTESSEQFEAYRALFLQNKYWYTGNTQIKVGDDVVLYGQVTIYANGDNKVYETVSGKAYVYSLNGVTEEDVTPPSIGDDEKGGKNNPYTVADALAVIDGMSNGATGDVEVYVKGIVTAVTEVSTSYGNATYLIGDTADATNTLTVYRGKYLEGASFTSADQIAVGAEVVVCGKLQKYVKSDVVTPEIAAGSTLVSIKLDTTTPVFGASINSETAVAAAGGTKTVTVTGNVAWTASVTGAATLSAASGEGAGTITVTIPANTSETVEPEFVVTVSTTADVATKSYAFTIKQNKYVAPSGNAYVKVTNTEDLTDGKYLIVSEDYNVAFPDAEDKGNNVYAVTITDGMIESSTDVDAHAFTITLANGFIQGPNGNYIGQTSDANGLKAEAEGIQNSITIDADGNAVISSGGAYLRYNSSSGDTNNRFRYYKSTSYTGQKAIQLYKKSN